MNNGNEAIEALLAGIQYMIDEAIKKAPYDKIKNGKIVSANGDGTYQVLLDGNEYRASSLGNATATVGEIVRVVIPQNSYNGLFFLKGGGGSSGSATWGSITGTLSNQTDLSNSLTNKVGNAANTNTPIYNIWYGTLAQYNALATKDQNTLYFIPEE